MAPLFGDQSGGMAAALQSGYPLPSTMQAYGSDRVRSGDGGKLILDTRMSKGWTARVARTFTSAEFPGTAVLWDDQYFQVVEADSLPQGGVRYVLEPWPDNHAMRLTDRYDAESEEQRIEEHQRQLSRESSRKSANALGLLTGHLPAVVQEEMARELGILPARLTFISILGEYAVLAGLVLYCVAKVMAQEPIPPQAFFPAVFLGIENTIRFLINWTQSRPIGSVIGWIAYALYHAISARGPSPFATEKGYAVKYEKPPAKIVARDKLSMREPLLTLLTPVEQARAAARYGYDYKRESAVVAAILLGGALIGVFSSYARGALISLLLAAALAAEQIVRLVAFRRGPAGSVLRFVVRPFVRKLVA